MTKRAWWLVGVNILIPGSAQILAGNRRLGRFGAGATFILWAIIAIAVVVYFLSRATLISLVTHPISLWALQAGLAFYAALWIILTVDTLRLVRLVKTAPGARPLIVGLTVIVLVIGAGGAAWGAYAAGITRSTLGTVFAGGDLTPPVNGRYNILLLGGDAGPDRDGLRPDSISVVSIEANTGKATIIGVPRNLENAPFLVGSPMATLYPNGYGAHGCNVDVCLLNSIYTEVQLNSPELYPNAVKHASQPGIEATRDAVQGVLGITLQYYVLIDMQGFSDLVDALGGVTIESTERLPLNGDLTAAGQPINVTDWIEPGVQHMNGFTALWYARVRHGSSDYDRMARQRQVQQAIVQQFDPANVLTKFQAVAQAGSQVVKTDIPQGMLGYFVELATKTRAQPVSQLELVPPLVDVVNPSFDDIHQLVGKALAISTPSPAP